MADQLTNQLNEDDEEENLVPQNPQLRLIQGLDGSADDAARAGELSAATGANSVLIHHNLDNFEKQLKVGMASQLMVNNQHLQDYVNQAPLGPTVSNDDWGQLDKVSRIMDWFLERQGIPGPSMLGAFARGFAEGHQPGIGIPDEEWQKLDQLSTKEPVQAAFVKALMAIPKVYRATEAAHEVSRIFTGGFTGFMAAAEQWYIDQTGDQAAAIKFARDLGVAAQVGIPEVAGGIGGVPEFGAIASKAGKAYQVSEPWLKAGQAPPARLDPALTQIAKQQARTDIGNLDELFKETQKSSTRNRDPESFRTFADLKLGDSTLGISADKVLELYGDGTPEPGDNKLGWVPHIEAQFQRARESGYDIEVPFKDFLARTSPEVYDTLHDGIRIRGDGLTLDEAKEVKPAKLPEPEAVEGEVPELPQAHETLGEAVHGWEVAEPGDNKFLDLPEAGEPGQTVKGTLADAKSLSSFTLKDVLPKMQEHFEKLPEDAKLLSQFWGRYLEKEAPDQPVHVVDREDFKKMFKNGDKALGMYSSNGDIILPHDLLTQWPDWYASQVVLHEGAHAITVSAINKFPEIKSKVKALLDSTKELQAQVTPNTKYGFKNEAEFLAEGIANPQFRRLLQDTPLKPELAETMGVKGRAATYWDMFKNIVRDLWEQLTGTRPELSVMDAFFKIQEEIENANRTLKEMAGEDFAAEIPPELEKVFKNGQALGMNVARLEQYIKLAKDQLNRDHKIRTDTAQMEAAARATQEWKDNYDRVRGEVKSDILARPDIAADRFLRTGELPTGESLKKVQLDPKSIDPELRSKIPEDFLRDGGVGSDDLARVFGYQSGDQLVKSLARLSAERELQGLTPAGHLTGLVNREAEARMQRQYGVNAQDIIDRAKEEVVSPTRMDLLHAELQALAGDKPISKEMIRAQAKQEFDSTPLGINSSEKFLNLMSREGQKFEEAMVEGNGADAFKAKQFQIKLGHQLKLALQYEKKLKSFDTRVDRWVRRAPPGMDPADAVWIHQILRQIGYDKEISAQDLARRKDLYGEYDRLRDYVTAKNKSPRDMYNSDPDAVSTVNQIQMADFLLSENYRNTVPEMLPPEFDSVFDSLKSIAHYSREEFNAERDASKQALADNVSGLVERLKASVGGEPITKGEQKRSISRHIGSLLLNPETWFNTLDELNRRGPFNQLILKPLMQGQYELRTLEKKFAKMWKELPRINDYNKTIENPGLWVDPKDGYTIDMTKGMAYGVLQNMGNAVNRKKLLMGWGIAKSEAELPAAEARVWQWLQSVGIDEKALGRATQIGDLFSQAFEKSEIARKELSGVAPARIDLYTVQTPWGEVKEWYNPLIADPTRYKQRPKVEEMVALGEDGFHRPSPAAGYTKERTGALYPIHLSLDSLPFKLKQVLNDAAMRVPITQVGKIVFHPDFQEAFAKYYGKEYQSALTQWMKHLAGNQEWVPMNIQGMHRVINNIAQNLATLQIGMNLGTVLKHGPTAAVFSMNEVGTLRFLKHFARTIGEWPGTRESWKFAMENSEELQNRMHSVEESMSSIDRDLFPPFKGKFVTFREAAQRLGSKPVGYSDLISAVTMWNAEYERLLEEDPDMTHGDAVHAANTAVRRTHGSSLIASRAGILRMGPMGRLALPYYNFFSNALQRNYEAYHFAQARLQGKELPAMRGFDAEVVEKNKLAAAKAIVGGLIVYGIMPSLIESMAESITGHDDKKEGWGHWAARSLTQAWPAQVPYVRDIANYMLHGYDPNLGMYGSLSRDVGDAVNPKAWIKDPGTLIRKVNQTAGLLTGITYDPLGRAAQFWINYEAGKEHPKGPWDFAKGTMRGTLKVHR